MKILPQLLAILSSLQGYVANRPSGARHAAAGSGGISMSFGLRVKQETQMRQTCITLAITTLIPITASASGLTYSESRLSYQSQESNSNTARRANLNLGFEAGPISMVCAIFTGALITTQARRKRTSRLDHMWRTDCLSRVWSLLRREIPMTTADTGFAPNMIRHLARLVHFIAHGTTKRKIREFTPLSTCSLGCSAA